MLPYSMHVNQQVGGTVPVFYALRMWGAYFNIGLQKGPEAKTGDAASEILQEHLKTKRNFFHVKLLKITSQLDNSF